MSQTNVCLSKSYNRLHEENMQLEKWDIGIYETMWIQGYKVVQGEDKTQSCMLIFSNLDIVVPNKSWNSLLPSHA